MVTASALAIIALAATAGCSSSGEKRDYTVPSSLCGMAVPSGELRTFLPAGSKISVQDTTPVDRTKRCIVTVDGDRALVASREWWEKKDDIATVAFAHSQVKTGELGDRGRILYSELGAVGKTRCVDAAHPEDVLYVAVEAYNEGSKNAPGMKKLIASYTNAVESSSDCR
ncbi:hypothetical protein ABZY20_18415 [Streptomyces sp. NPDC006624]|uniref:hypothetical protein n=1 Tax=Streptomyces sp. NPDC006624 TaxID=3154892 RepID=UPI0033A4299A